MIRVCIILIFGVSPVYMAKLGIGISMDKEAKKVQDGISAMIDYLVHFQDYPISGFRIMDGIWNGIKDFNNGSKTPLSSSQSASSHIQISDHG